jgi:hypothetical protein
MLAVIILLVAFLYAECCFADCRYAVHQLSMAVLATTFFHNLRIFVISYSVCPWQTFPA